MRHVDGPLHRSSLLLKRGSIDGEISRSRAFIDDAYQRYQRHTGISVSEAVTAALMRDLSSGPASR